MQISILMGILIELLKAKKTNAQTLSEKFEISTRSVYRYIDILCESGVPILSLLGKNGGFAIEGNFCLEKTFFTIQEIKTLSALCENNYLIIKQKLDYILQNNFVNI